MTLPFTFYDLRSTSRKSRRWPRHSQTKAGQGEISPKNARIEPLNRFTQGARLCVRSTPPKAFGAAARMEGLPVFPNHRPTILPLPAGEGRGEGESSKREYPTVHGEAHSAFRTPHSAFQRAFTLVELLVVIAIIAILAAMLIPVFGAAMTRAKKTQAKLQVGQIAGAIEQYNSQYSRMPVSSYVQQSGSNNVTYGGPAYTSASSFGNLYPGTNSGSGWSYYGPGGLETPVGLYITSNSDVMAILLDLTNFPNSTTWTVNTNYQINPMRTAFLTGSYTADSASPGIGTDLNYRDPWGNPYLITMDLNEDNKAQDPFYAPVWMSSSTGVAGGAGVYGLSYQDPDGNPADGSYLFHGNVMVWSMGPNGPYNHSPSSFTYPFPSGTPAPAGGGNTAWAMDPSNKNHILSWTQ